MASAAMAEDGSPTALRIILGGRLRRLRRDRGITPTVAGEAIRGSHAKISRLERGLVGFKERDVADLLTLYGVTDAEERDGILTLVRRANTPGWWHEFHDLLPPWMDRYLGLEQGASVVRSYEALFVPPLLQTPDYARALMHRTRAEPPDDVRRRVELLTRRQRMLTRAEDPPTLWTVIDEAALRRPVGGLRVHREQLRALLKACQLPTVTVQVLLSRAGGHAAAGGPFTVLRFPQPDLADVVFLQQLTSALYLDKPDDLDRYHHVLDQLSVQAAPPERTPELLTALLSDQ